LVSRGAESQRRQVVRPIDRKPQTATILLLSSIHCFFSLGLVTMMRKLVEPSTAWLAARDIDPAHLQEPDAVAGSAFDLTTMTPIRGKPDAVPARPRYRQNEVTGYDAAAGAAQPIQPDPARPASGLKV
jgi:hypothetical protein